MQTINYNPIGIFHCSGTSAVLAPRQGVLAKGRTGRIELFSNISLDMLSDLEGFTKIWLLFHFHKSKGFSSKVVPPHRDTARGLFATRAPRRPNALGMSAVTLVSIESNIITVSEHDLLDGTPILDIKPYLPYADSFPDARSGWVDEAKSIEKRYKVEFEKDTLLKSEFIGKLYEIDIKLLLDDQLSLTPLGNKRKRIVEDKKNNGFYLFSWRTWRFRYCVEENKVIIVDIFNAVADKDCSKEPDEKERKKYRAEFKCE
ncbi:MAG: tRNA (N6-threonylcarbamoyladenosine(37)-N6)-methyltransferase TrmO [Fibrobacteres bacterium]|nr:tRNA (N6-threonylcarbamoyladenosine(37)-N6)-methyltransferase TrmO [Fibrobacterota bacterium]